ALSYLLTYPYNCLEQQVSKLAALVQAPTLIKDFKLADGAALRKQAQEIVDTLPSYQHVSGGYGYWPDSLPDPYVTAYALDIALAAKQNGISVPVQSINKAVTWLAGAFNQQHTRAYDYSLAQSDTTRAYTAYVLARYGKNIDSLFNTLYAKRTGLTPTAVSYLLEAAHATSRSASIQRTLAQQLKNKVIYAPGSAYVDAGASMPWLHSNNISTTAHVLRALLTANQPLDQDFQLASWLLTQVNAKGYWRDTHTSAAVLKALETYYTARESAVPNFTATVSQANHPLFTAAFEGRTTNEQVKSLPFDTVYKNGTDTLLTFAKTGSGTLYYNLAQHYTPAIYTTPVNAGFEVSRTISTLTGEPAQQLITGQRYKVTVHVKNASGHNFVVVEDFIPAGFRIVNPSLATESASQAELLRADNKILNRVEYYDDRVYFFADQLPAGEHTFSYLVTALSAGTYTYPAAWASQMYD
ncbi:MAG: hypothetical protein IKW71_02345, partial [Elusimicrobiaceae bacterium]|nr:hypothetical protein [Elusimicrobiaceae bacterium]